MDKLMASLFVSLDNLMAGENEDMSWVMGDFDPEMGRDMDAEVTGSMQAILLGRTTYEICLNIGLERGKPLFKDINPKQDLKLIKTRDYQNGVMKLILQPKK